MDHEDSGLSLGVVRVPADRDTDSDPELVEQIDQVVYQFAPSLPPEMRRNFEEKMDAVRRAAKLKDLDQVTGLLNRRAATHMYHRIIGRSRNTVGLFLADVDDFKNINSLYTRAGGDKVLGAIGLILQEKARDVEITIARLGEGADEFMGLLREMPDRSTFERIVCRIATALNSPDIQREAGYIYDAPLHVSMCCALVSLYGQDRRDHAAEIGKKIYQELSLAVDRAKQKRKDFASLDTANQVIPMISLTVHKAEVSLTMETMLSTPCSS
jgi:diguanylate cyclase (GGDEF)-like protein